MTKLSSLGLTTLALALTVFLSPAARAHGMAAAVQNTVQFTVAHTGHGGHPTHEHVTPLRHTAPHQFLLTPYICDTQFPATQTAAFVRQLHRIPLQVTGVTEPYCQANAGAVISFPSSFVLNSVSLLVKSNTACFFGPWLNVVYIDPNTQTEEIAFAVACQATTGKTTADGYTQLTWSGPVQTEVPTGAQIISMGINNDSSQGGGTMLVDRVLVNGVPVTKNLRETLQICPFVDPDCDEEGGGEGGGNG